MPRSPSSLHSSTAKDDESPSRRSFSPDLKAVESGENYTPYALSYSRPQNHQLSYVNLLTKKDTIVGSHHHRRVTSVPLNQLAGKDDGSSIAVSQETLTYPPKMIPVPKDPSEPTFWQKLFPESLACRLYVLTVVIETIIDLIIEGELLLRFRSGLKTESSQKMKTFLSIFAIAHVFQFVMALDAVWARNTLQFVCLTIFNFLFLIYAVIQIGEIRATLSDATAGLVDVPVHVLTTIIPCVIGIAELAFIALGWKIYNEFGWKVYKFIGADRRLRKMYGNYQIFQCLIKFDVFFWVGFSVQFIIIVLDRADWEFYVTCAALPLSLILLVEGYLGARYESKMLMYTFMLGCASGLIYFVYKLIRVVMGRRDKSMYGTIWKSLTTFSVLSIILLLATIIFAFLVLKAFNQGLKAALERKETTQHRVGGSVVHNRAASSNLINRMSIE